MSNPLFNQDSQTLSEDNPYSIGFIFVHDNGDVELQRDLPVLDNSPRDQYYTLRKGESLWDVAFDFYGDSKWWWLLRDANNLNDNPFDITQGLTILIPDLEKTKISLGND